MLLLLLLLLLLLQQKVRKSAVWRWRNTRCGFAVDAARAFAVCALGFEIYCCEVGVDGAWVWVML